MMILDEEKLYQEVDNYYNLESCYLKIMDTMLVVKVVNCYMINQG